MPRVMSSKTAAALDAQFTSIPEVRGLVKDLPGGEGNALIQFTDWHYLKTTLAFLTTVPGEKHVVVLTERSFPRRASRTIRWRTIHSNSRRAPAPRCRLSIPAGCRRRRLNGGGRFTRQPLDLMVGRLAQRDLANQTGGTSAFFQYAAKPLDALDRATRSYYVLGYYPIREVLPEQYRRVEVSVTREGSHGALSPWLSSQADSSRGIRRRPA